MKDLCLKTMESKARWARNMGYRTFNTPFFSPYTHPSWQKMQTVRNFLNLFDRVIWMDADVVITNEEFFFPEMAAGFHASRDWGIDAGESDFSCGVYIAHKDCIPFFDAALDLYEEWANKPRWDNDAMIEVSDQYSDLINIYPRRYLNAVPKQVHESVVEPWHPSDFACHITMVPIGRKLEILKEIESI